jgi:prepilin-type N-terminal cleavage/methylation domain-containing protein
MIMHAKSNNGFTLVELLVAVALSGLVLVGVTQLYMSGMRSYSLQSQITEMNQNAQYTIQLLTEEIQQAGVDLPPDSLYAVLTQNLGDAYKSSITISVNPKEGVYTIPADITTQKIQLANAAGFIGATSILRLKAAHDSVKTLAVLSVDTLAATDTIRLAAATSFKKGDVIYNYRTKTYFKSGTNFYLDTTSNILAENIDSLAFRFHNLAKTVVGDWKSMRSVRLYVRARAAQPDPRYKNPPYNDGYRRIVLSNEFQLRNKF